MTSQAQALDNRSDTKRVLNIQEHKTAKGITFWHVEDNTLPIVTLNFAFRGSGSAMDPEGKTGLGQLISNTIDEGAGDRDANEFQTALEDHVIELSFANSRDHFSGKLKTLVRHQELAFDLLSDALHKPRFDEEAIDRMRQANIARIKSSSAKPNWIASRLMNDTFFADHAYAKNSGGTIAGLGNIKAEDMHDFVIKNFTRDRLVIGTAGNISSDDMKLIIDRIFSDLPEEGSPVNIGSVIPPVEVWKSYQKDSPQSVVQMVWNLPLKKYDPEYHALQTMNYILGGGGFASFLMEEVREKQGLTYGIYSQPVFLDQASYIAIESATSPENVEPMIASISGVLDQMKTTVIDAKMLEDAKNYLIGSLPLRFSTTLSLSGTALRMQLDGRPIDALDQWKEKISRLTADDIQKMANTVFISNQPNAMVITGAVPDGFGGENIDVVPGIEE